MVTVTFNEFCDNISDLKENILNGNVKVVPLKNGKKAPRDNGWTKKDYSIEDLEKSNTNLGIMPGYNHKKNGVSLAIIDIDGYTMNMVSANEKQYYKDETKKYIFECLKDIPGAMHVRTQSNGYHIYIWNRTVIEKFHEVSNNLHFPDDFYISELRGKSLKHSIEIFTKESSKQCLLPGCIIIDEATGNENTYSIISDINTLSDIGTVDNVADCIVKILTENHNFSYHKPQSKTENNQLKSDNNKPTELKDLTKKEIMDTVDTIVPVIKLLDGTKHKASLFLGGYLSENITYSSCNKLCNNIIHQIGNIFNDSAAFKKTILNNYTTTREDKAGLPKLCEIINAIDPTYNIHKFRYELEKNCKSNYIHSILSKEYSHNKKKYIDIDYTNHKISTHIWNQRLEVDIDDDGNETKNYTTFWTEHYDLLNMSPTDIFETYNILDKNASPKICLKFYRNGMPNQQLIEGNDIQLIEKQLAKRPGVVLKPHESKGVLNEIIREYVKLEQIHTVEEIPVQGIFLNPSTGKLARADVDNAIPINLPTTDAISQAVSVWEDLENVYPGENSKLAHILRWGIVSPFSYILKTKYTWYPMLFLYGASRTSKTTLAEISLSPYTDINEEISIGGGSFDTPYRIGKALSRQGIGTIINEPGNTISSDLNIEVIKRAVESAHSREKQEDGVHTKVPAYSNMCFTSNKFIPTHDAFVRRTDYLEFTKKERLSEDDITKFNKTFNHQNWHNTRFTDLRPIGDFMCYYVNEHQDILGSKREDLEFGLLDGLFGYIGERTPKWLKSAAELLDVSDADNEILNEFRRMFMRDYKNLTKNSNKIHRLAEEVSVSVEFGNGQLKVIDDDSSTEDFRKLVRAVVMSNNIDYMYWHNDGVIINTSVKNALKDFCGLQVTCKGLADYMDKKDTVFKYKGNSVRGFKLSFDEFISFLNGGTVTKKVT